MDKRLYDPLWDKALEIVKEDKIATVLNFQRKLWIGYNRASRLLETMEELKIVGFRDGSKPRLILESNKEISKRIRSFRENKDV